MAEQLFGKRAHHRRDASPINGLPYTVVGKIRKKDQDSNYSGPDNNKIFMPFAAMLAGPAAPGRRARGASRTSSSRRTPEVVAELPGVLDRRTGRIDDIDWPLEQNVRAILARRHGFDPADRQALQMWDTSLQSLMFDRMVDSMGQFFTLVGVVTLGLGGIGVMNIMLIAVKERTREIGVRKALGATTAAIQRQFFLEGFVLTMLSGVAGMRRWRSAVSRWSTWRRCRRDSPGMIVSWEIGASSRSACWSRSASSRRR